VGDGGKIIRTTDSGVTWSNIPFGTTADLTSIHRVSSTEVVVAGWNGKFLRSVNGGLTWTMNSPLIGASILGYQDIHFVNSNVGFLLHSHGVHKTTDGGSSWTSHGVDGRYPMYCVYFLNSTTGFVGGGNGKIYKTTDGGVTWIPQSTLLTATIRSILFVSSTRGYAVGTEGRILTTIDGGESWQSQPSGGSTYQFYDVSFPDENTGYVVGLGIMKKTTNKGLTWSTQTAATTNSMLSVEFASTNVGISVGYFGWAQRTANGGVTGVHDKTFVGSGLANDILSAYPNPFNTSTRIIFQARNTERVRIEILDIQGREVFLAVDGSFGVGTHQVEWNAGAQSSGIYFLRYTNSEVTGVHRLLLLK
jgi:photosystem II stability/assembly factor-like uncharacterized protein